MIIQADVKNNILDNLYHKLLFVSYSLWNEFFKGKVIEIFTDDTWEKGYCAFPSGINEKEFILYLLPIDIQKIVMGDRTTSITINFDTKKVSCYSETEIPDKIIKKIDELTSEVKCVPDLELKTMVERKCIPARVGEKDFATMFLQKVLSKMDISEDKIGLIDGERVIRISTIEELLNTKIDGAIMYNNVTKEFVGYDAINRRFVGYNLGNQDEIVEFIDDFKNGGTT